MDRQKWGLAGLLAFEAIVASFLFGNGADLDFVVSYALGAVILGAALLVGPQRWQFAILAALASYRAFEQMPSATWGTYPTWLVPLGFAWLALAPRTMPRLAIAAVALARTWFVLWYYPGLLQDFGSMTLVWANVLGAAGAWLWLSADEAPDDGAAVEDARATP